MTWIRNPWWDGFWILSGLPIGLLLILTWLFSPALGLALFAAAIVLEQAHVLSPMVLVWTHNGLRRMALERWAWFVALPVAVLVAAFLVPMGVLFGIYWSWNIYHYGMQNFGVVSLYRRNARRTSDGHIRDALLCVGLTVFVMAAMPFILPYKWADLLFVGVLGFNHWLVDIGLSSRVSGRAGLFIGAVLIIGCIGFLWKVPRVDHIATAILPAVWTARWGVGIVHFLYSRWVWRLSDPAVRASIGRDIFHLDTARSGY